MNGNRQFAIESNLSYVLHEPSTSPVVRRYASEWRKESAARSRVVDRLSRLTDYGLRERIVVEPMTAKAHSDRFQEAHILSVKVGAWRLLPRVLAISGLIPTQASTVVSFIDDESCDQSESLTFYRAAANLCMPRWHPGETGAWFFAAALVRPGGRSILVRFAPLTQDDQEGRAALQAWQYARPLAEKSIREFIMQWGCNRPLWNSPAEETLPEFRLKVDGTTECGR